MKRLGIERIAAYSPEAHGRSERMFRAHQERLPRELALAGITDMAGANRYLADVYRPAFNAEFMQLAMEEGSAFVGWIGGALDDIPGERFERTVGNDNGVSFERMKWQIPADRHRCHDVKAKVPVLRHTDRTLTLLQGQRKLADYDSAGNLLRTATVRRQDGLQARRLIAATSDTFRAQLLGRVQDFLCACPVLTGVLLRQAGEANHSAADKAK